MIEHPIRRVLTREGFLADAARWADKLFGTTGSGTIIIELNVKGGRFITYQVSGASARVALEEKAS